MILTNQRHGWGESENRWQDDDDDDDGGGGGGGDDDDDDDDDDDGTQAEILSFTIRFHSFPLFALNFAKPVHHEGLRVIALLGSLDPHSKATSSSVSININVAECWERKERRKDTIAPPTAVAPSAPSKAEGQWNI